MLSKVTNLLIPKLLATSSLASSQRSPSSSLRSSLTLLQTMRSPLLSLPDGPQGLLPTQQLEMEYNPATRPTCAFLLFASDVLNEAPAHLQQPNQNRELSRESDWLSFAFQHFRIKMLQKFPTGDIMTTTRSTMVFFHYSASGSAECDLWRTVDSIFFWRSSLSTSIFSTRSISGDSLDEEGSRDLFASHVLIEALTLRNRNGDRGGAGDVWFELITYSASSPPLGSGFRSTDDTTAHHTSHESFGLPSGSSLQ
jgi:hypothetical protein